MGVCSAQRARFHSRVEPQNLVKMFFFFATISISGRNHGGIAESTLLALCFLVCLILIIENHRPDQSHRPDSGKCIRPDSGASFLPSLRRVGKLVPSSSRIRARCIYIYIMSSSFFLTLGGFRLNGPAITALL